MKEQFGHTRVKQTWGATELPRKAENESLAGEYVREEKRVFRKSKTWVEHE